MQDIVFDSLMVVVSVVICFLGLGYLQGVREGTINASLPPAPSLAGTTT